MRALPVLLVALCGASAPAFADDVVTPKLPTFALEQSPMPSPGATSPATSPWTGLHVGTEVFAVSGKGVKGGVGGALVAGYDRELPNNFVIGIDFATGYAPSVFRNGPYKGFDYAATTAKVGYDMGRLMPFVTTSFAIARPNITSGGYLGATESANDLFNSSSRLQGAASVGAGFDYAVTDNLHMGLAVSVGTSRGGLVAP
jgi:outer membrane immunogenic protein